MGGYDSRIEGYDLRLRVEDLRLRVVLGRWAVMDLGLRVYGLRLRVEDLGLRVGFRVEGLWLRVQGCFGALGGYVSYIPDPISTDRSLVVTPKKHHRHTRETHFRHTEETL